MTDQQNGTPQDTQPENEQPSPRFVPSRPGRMVSLYGLVERIVEQFEIEHGEGESDVIRSTTSEVERRKLVRDVAEYIFGVESVQLSPHEQAQLIGMANAEIFGYGPLDQLFNDPNVTTITLEGAHRVGVRYGPAQELQMIDPIFDDTPHMRRIVQRLLHHADAELREDVPIIETGLTAYDRRISLSVATPPYVPEIAVDIRVHPRDLPLLDEWVAKGILNEQTQTLLSAIAQSDHGFMIVGDTESGKTTLLSMLLSQLPGDNLVCVDRASEIQLQDGAIRLTPQWPQGNRAGMTFGEQIVNALAHDPATLVIDEIRNDEPQSIAPLLTTDHAPRQIWSFRGATESKRLRSALGMLARMADSTQPEFMVDQLSRRLPFIIVIKRRRGKLQIREVAEWQFENDQQITDDFVYADYVPLMQVEWEDCQVTGKRPQHTLDIPDEFWQS